jgi:signal transduction histidine kinase
MTVSKSLERITAAASPHAEVIPLPYRLVFLFAPKTPTWFKQFHDNVASIAIYTTRCTDSDSYENTIAAHQPDVLIGFGSAACARLFTGLILLEPANRPICVLVENGDDETNAAADLVCPPSVRLLRRQLETVLGLRADLRGAQAQIETLRSDARKAQRKARDNQRRLKQSLAKAADSHAAEVAQLRQTIATLEQALEEERERLREHQRESIEFAVLKDAIVYNVSHEFRTPLLQLKGSVSLLHEDAPDSPLTKMALQSGAKLEALVKNVTQLASSLDIELAPVVIREVIEAATRNFERSLIHKDSADRVRLHIEPRLPPVIGDKQGLMTVIEKLVENGLKFSNSNPVDVRAMADGDGVLIQVQDYGIGIDEAEYKRIFKTFYQIDGSSTRGYGGMGIGLAIVQIILDKHGVGIDVRSVRGVGTTFSFRLSAANLKPDSPDAPSES